MVIVCTYYVGIGATELDTPIRLMEGTPSVVPVRMEKNQILSFTCQCSKIISIIVSYCNKIQPTNLEHSNNDNQSSGSGVWHDGEGMFTHCIVKAECFGLREVRILFVIRANQAHYSLLNDKDAVV